MQSYFVPNYIADINARMLDEMEPVEGRRSNS